MLKKVSVILFFLCLSVGVVFAQSTKESDKEKPEFDFALDFNLGLSSYEDIDGAQQTYQKFAFFPIFTYGKWGLALDLTFEFDGDFNLRDLDKDGRADRWQGKDKDGDGKADSGSIITDYIQKIYYIRYGFKGDPLYGLIGQFEGYSLGHGLIMENFTNKLYYPQVVKLGLNLDVDGEIVNFPLIGVETVVDDILDWDIIGARAYMRPLLNVSNPLVSELKFGATVVTDLDPLNDPTDLPPGDDPASEAVTEFGFDVGMPLLLRDDMDLLAYADWASIVDKGSGAFIGTTYTYNWFRLLGQLRFFGEQFVVNYFDTYYDVERATKYASLDLYDEFYMGYLIGTELAILKLFEFYFTWEDGFTDVAGPRIQTGISTVEGAIAKLDFAVDYDKKDIDDFSDVFSEEDSLFRATVVYHVTPSASILFIYERAYSPYTGDVAGRTYIETQFSF